jgi:hypothetical protein
MNFRDSIGSLSGVFWSIDLATHLNTKLGNETSPPDLQPGPGRRKAEERYAGMVKRRDPISGYNCFGLAFAGRRAGLYITDIDIELIKVIELILSEDGYGEVTNDAEIRVGDVVIYLDEKGPTHAAVVVKLEPSLALAGTGQTIWVISKFDEVSGEYEHSIDNFAWSMWPVSRNVYRPRERAPKKLADKPENWKQRLSALDT